ncbi:hypothetical protein EJ03DRAFT_58481 [Teratosphaeria nubilosa]|uniref:Uncharacterized protein n=1 Tax=Teratosphaeria nubilosa TaxID=161662 RepID=A0A6G1KTV6_9PEZI|nr:hypothetical protein EJ03DRAFT_58481 [Teratosphaeria nubilosa]
MHHGSKPESRRLDSVLTHSRPLQVSAQAHLHQAHGSLDIEQSHHEPIRHTSRTVLVLLYNNERLQHDFRSNTQGYKYGSLRTSQTSPPSNTAMVQQIQRTLSTTPKNRPPDSSMALFRCQAVKCGPISGVPLSRKNLLTFTWPVQDLRAMGKRVVKILGMQWQTQQCELWWHLPGADCQRDARPFSDLYEQTLRWQHHPGKSVHFHVRRGRQPGTEIAFRVYGKICSTADNLEQLMTFHRPIASPSEVDHSYVGHFYQFQDADML